MPPGVKRRKEYKSLSRGVVVRIVVVLVVIVIMVTLELGVTHVTWVARSGQRLRQ